jgi:hypothetical protein
MGMLDRVFRRRETPISNRIGVHTNRTRRMEHMMEQSDGSSSLRAANLDLHNGASTSESALMWAIFCNKGAQVLGRVDSARDARTALMRAANLCDGIPSQEVMVDHFRRLVAHPDAMDDLQWIQLCRSTALDWAKHVPRFIELAKSLKRTNRQETAQ